MRRHTLAAWTLGGLLVATASAIAEPEHVAHPARTGELCEIDFGASSPTPVGDPHDKLDKAAGWAAHNPSGFLVLDGFAERTDHPAADIKLSLRRAQAVHDGLIRAGVDPDHIVIAAYGSDVASRTDPTDDRRVTIWGTRDDVNRVVAQLGNAEVIELYGVETHPRQVLSSR